MMNKSRWDKEYMKQILEENKIQQDKHYMMLLSHLNIDLLSKYCMNQTPNQNTCQLDNHHMMQRSY